MRRRGSRRRRGRRYTSTFPSRSESVGVSSFHREHLCLTLGHTSKPRFALQKIETDFTPRTHFPPIHNTGRSLLTHCTDPAT